MPACALASRKRMFAQIWNLRDKMKNVSFKCHRYIDLYKVKPQLQHHLEQIILRFSINAWNKISSSRAFEIKSNDGHFELKNSSTSPFPCFPFFSSAINLYFPIPDDSAARVSPLQPPPPPLYPLSFQLSYGEETAARYGPRPSYSARRSTREVHPEDLIGRKREREKEKGKGSVPRWCAGSRDETLSESEQAVLFHTGGHPRATHRRTTPTRAPIRTPRLWKKNSATPNDFFSSTPSRRTLITFLSEITLQGERGASPVDVNGPGRTGCRVANEKYRRGAGEVWGMRFFLPFFFSLSLSIFFYAENGVPSTGKKRVPYLSTSTTLRFPRDDDARPDYEMLNGTATAPAARYSSKFYSFWQLARPKGKPPPRGSEHAAAVLGQRVAAA